MRMPLRPSALASALLLLLAGAGTAAADSVTGTPAVLAAPDGAKLAATYYSAGRPGPGILLCHQCNMDRKSWNGLAEKLARAGFHVLTIDYRGFGESAGARHNERDAPRAAIRPTWNRGSNAPFRRHASHVAPYAIPASTSRCSANSLFIQSITARTQAARRRSRWTMIQYSAAISGIGRVSRSSSGWPSPT